MPEIYADICPQIFFPNFWGGICPLVPSFRLHLQEEKVKRKEVEGGIWPTQKFWCGATYASVFRKVLET